LKASEITRKIKVWIRKKSHEMTISSQKYDATNNSRSNKDLISIVYTYMIKVIQTMEASTTRVKIVACQSTAKTLTKIVDTKTKSARCDGNNNA
jgi:viroplasmin and RNaseH domain-containing protein